MAVKTVSVDLYNRVYKIVDDLVNMSCDHVEDMIVIIHSKTFRMFTTIGYDEYKILILGRTIGHALHSSFGVDNGLAWNATYEAIINKFKFKQCLDPKSNEAFIHHLTNFVCRNLSFDKSMELEKKALQSDQEIEKTKSDVKENDHHDKEQEKLAVKNQQQFQVGDLVSFEEDGWYYQSLIHGVCYNKDCKRWSYVIVAIDDFRCITGIEANKLTLLKKSKTSIDTVVQNNKVERVYRGYISKSQEIEETLLSAVHLIEGISEDDILNLHTLDDCNCDIIETTYDFIRYIIYYVCSYSDNDYEFDEDKGLIVQLKDNGTQRIDTPLYEFVKFELKPILVEQIKKTLL